MVALTSAYFIAFNQKSSTLYNDKTNQFIHKKPSVIINRITSKEPGIYYFGFPTCPWCLELLPILDDMLIEENDTAYVVNTRGENYTEKDDILLQNFYKKYTKDDKLSVPFVIAINNSKEVRVNVGTVTGHDASVNKMTQKQQAKLKKILKNMISFSKT